MADPITALAVVGMGASAVGAGVSAYGKLKQGSSDAAMYNYQAGVARVNAQVAKQDSNYSLAAGEVSAEQSGMKTGAEIGTTRAAFGASNLTGGSQDRVVKSEVEIGQESQEIIRANAAKRAYGYDVAVSSDIAQAGAMDTAAKTSKESGVIGAISSIIGGVGSVSSKWLQMGPSFGGGGTPTQGGMGLYDGAQTGSLY